MSRTEKKTKEQKEKASAVSSDVEWLELSVTDLYEFIRFKGYDKNAIRNYAIVHFGSEAKAVNAALIVVEQGPKKAMANFPSIGILPRTGKGRLTVNSLQHAFADEVSKIRLDLKIPKKIEEEECPAELQFSGAISIKMNKKNRQLHKRFSVAFSTRLGGRFNEAMYDSISQKVDA